MLEWILRWGVPLGLIAAYVLTAAPLAQGPGAVAQHALDSLRDLLMSFVPNFF